MSDALTIYVYRRENGWESDVWRCGDQLGGCTAPTLAGCIDTTHEIIADSDPEWADFDANKDSRKRHMYQAKHSKNAEIVEAPVVMSDIMTHNELLAKMNQRYWKMFNHNSQDQTEAGIEHRQLIQEQYFALRAIVELHKPSMQWSGGYDVAENPLYVEQCQECSSNGCCEMYPCATIQAIEKELR